MVFHGSDIVLPAGAARNQSGAETHGDVFIGVKYKLALW
jgi:hypothetical protein